MDFKRLLVLFGIASIVTIFFVIYIVFIDDTIYDDPNIEAVDFDIGEAEQLLETFGFNKRFGCITIAQKKYTDTYKAIMALNNVDTSLIHEEKCSNLYNNSLLVDKDLESERYELNNGSCKDNAKVISYDDANLVYKKMYGREMPKTSIDSREIDYLFHESYDYNSDKDAFVLLECYNCLGSCYSLHIREIISATTKKDILRIDFYDYESGLFELNDDHYNLVTSNHSKIFTCTYNEECMDIIKRDYMDYLDIYEAIFQYKDDHYIFRKFIKKTNEKRG